MHPGHIRPFKVMAMAFLHLANLPTKIHNFYTKCIGQFGLNLCSGNRSCPNLPIVFSKCSNNYKI